MRRQATDWKKILAKDIYDKELLPKIHKELLELNYKKINKPTKKRAKGFIRCFIKEDIQMENKHKMFRIICHQGNTN